MIKSKLESYIVTSKLFLITILLMVHISAVAQIEFVITESGASAISIAVLPFNGNDQSTSVAKVVADDLKLTGQFKTLAQEQMVESPNDISEINFATWKLLGADYLTIGSVQKGTGDRLELHAKLFSVLEKNQVLSLVLPIYESEIRAGSHYVADKIYEKITGVPGVFSTKIAYVTAIPVASNDIDYKLMVADADGKNSQALVTSKQPLLSPSWSPNGEKIVYVSFEKGNSAIYSQELSTGKRELLSNSKGINSGPSFSPDGKSLSLTLSKSGNAEIYIMDLITRQLKKITNSWSIDTNSSWSPNGESLLFTSDRGGKPNLYTVNLNNMDAKRITFEGDYNAGGTYSPDGEYIGYVQASKNNYKIALRHNKSETHQIISNGPLDETPTFAPNSNMILYATKNKNGQGILISTSLDGKTKNQLIISKGHIREPSWSPILN